MVTITLVEIAFYIAFTVVYSIEVFNSNPSSDGNQGKVIQEDQIYRWSLTAVLLLALIYFLWHSVSLLSRADSDKKSIDGRQDSHGVSWLCYSASPREHFLHVQRIQLASL